MILRATVWDDAAGEKLNPEPKEITVLEAVNPDTVVGSGLTQSKEVQLENLSVNAALQIEKWMRQMQRSDGWTPHQIATHAFPAMAAQFYPLDRSNDVFGWDPG